MIIPYIVFMVYSINYIYMLYYTNLLTSCDHIEYLGSQICVVLPTQYVIYCMCTKSCDVTDNIQVVVVLMCLSYTMDTAV